MKNTLIVGLLSLALLACATPQPPNPINAMTRSTLKYGGYDLKWQLPSEQIKSSDSRTAQADFEATLRKKLNSTLGAIYNGNTPVSVKITATNLYLPGLGMNWLTGASPQINADVIVQNKASGETLGTYEVSAIWVNTHGLLSGIVQKASSRGNVLGNVFIDNLESSLSRR